MRISSVTSSRNLYHVQSSVVRRVPDEHPGSPLHAVRTTSQTPNMVRGPDVACQQSCVLLALLESKH
jgi:hypothetical protein